MPRPQELKNPVTSHIRLEQWHLNEMHRVYPSLSRSRVFRLLLDEKLLKSAHSVAVPVDREQFRAISRATTSLTIHEHLTRAVHQYIARLK